jgi:hypothetical protein
VGAGRALAVRPDRSDEGSPVNRPNPMERPDRVAARTEINGDAVSRALDNLTNRNNQMKRALEVIGRDGCDRYTAISGETCRTDGSTRTIDAEFTEDQWCAACIAAWALGPIA